MARPRIILLPGMDGTGLLFAPLLEQIPGDFNPLVVTYPTDRALNYDQLLARIESQLEGEEPFVLLGESFSGPLAIRYAVRHPDRVRALVLCVSFARFPAPWPIVFLVKLFARIPPPGWVLRFWLAGRDASSCVIQLLREALRTVDGRVLAHRFEQATRADVRPELVRCDVPMLYLRATEDRLISAKRRREISAIRPEMRVRKIASPHLLLQTAPQEAWNAIQEFIDSLPDPTREYEDPLLLGRF